MSLVASGPKVELTLRTKNTYHEMEIKAVNPIHSPNCGEQNNASVVVGGNSYVDCATTNFRIADNEMTAESSKKEEKHDLGSKEQGVEDPLPLFNDGFSSVPPERDLKSLDVDNCIQDMPSLGEEHPTVPAGSSVVHSDTKLTVPKEKLSETAEKTKNNQRYTMAPVLQNTSKSLGLDKVVNTYKRKQHCERNNLSVRTVQKPTDNYKDIYGKERKGNSTSISYQVSLIHRL